MGNPLPSIQWERDGQRILGNDARISLMENGTLQITALQVLQSRLCWSAFLARAAFILENPDTNGVLTYGYFKSCLLSTHIPSWGDLCSDSHHMLLYDIPSLYPDARFTPWRTALSNTPVWGLDTGDGCKMSPQLLHIWFNSKQAGLIRPSIIIFAHWTVYRWPIRSCESCIRR